MASEAPANKVEYFELFFDLVYVFILIQITATIAADGTLVGILHGLVVLLLVWVIWVAFSAFAALGLPSGATRDWRPLAWAVAMALLLLLGLTTPEAFWKDNKIFAFSYLVLAAIALGGQVLVTRQDKTTSRAILKRSALGMALPVALVISAYLPTMEQSVALIAVGLILTLLASVVFRVQTAPLSPSYTAERNSLFMLIVMGEMIISLGLGAAKAGISTILVFCVLASFALVVLLWRQYYTGVLLTGERHMEEISGTRLMSFARAGYTYLHFVMIAGLVLTAVSLKTLMAGVAGTLPDLLEIFLGIGLAVYVLGTVAFALAAGARVRRLAYVSVVLLALLSILGPQVSTPLFVLLAVVATAIGVDPRVWTMRAPFALSNATDPGVR